MNSSPRPRIDSLHNLLALQTWFNLAAGLLIGLTYATAVLWPDPNRTFPDAGTPGFSEANFINLMALTTTLYFFLLAALAVFIRRGLRQGHDVTAALWLNTLLNLISGPPGLVFAALQVSQFRHAPTAALIRQGRAQRS